jgi:hypothetical protein
MAKRSALTATKLNNGALNGSGKEPRAKEDSGANDGPRENPPGIDDFRRISLGGYKQKTRVHYKKHGDNRSNAKDNAEDCLHE